MDDPPDKFDSASFPDPAHLCGGSGAWKTQKVLNLMEVVAA